jgi:hypothetical protein
MPSLGLGAAQDELLANIPCFIVDISDEETGNFFGAEACVKADQHDSAITQGVAAGGDVLQDAAQLRFGDSGSLGQGMFLQ